MKQKEALLTIEDMRVYFPVYKGLFWQKEIGLIKAVDGVSLSVAPGEILGLVGESGSGKSTLGRAVMGLSPVLSGSIRFKDVELTSLTSAEFRPFRSKLQIIFQDPYSSLNPRMTVFDILAEPLRVHETLSAAEIQKRVSKMLEHVGLQESHLNRYPHEFSGGQRQRIAIARALIVRPELIIADEPVSALDVSIQAQILNLLSDLQKEFKLAMIFISHDLSVVEHISDHVAVMYQGKIVETATASQIYANPRHAYTRQLLAAIPQIKLT